MEAVEGHDSDPNLAYISEESSPSLQCVDFAGILREDWLEGSDIFPLKSASEGVLIYQVLSCVDVSVPSYRIEDFEHYCDDPEEDDQGKGSYNPPKTNKSTRMLKVVLFDGDSTRIAFEYEPVGAFDSFFDPETNTMSRCCAKVALYNSPVSRRNVFWLTNANVRLLFEGYSCKEFCPAKELSDDEIISELDSDEVLNSSPNQLDITPDIIELANVYLDSAQSQERDGSVNLELKKNEMELDKVDTMVKVKGGDRSSQSRRSSQSDNVPALKDYFPLESNYIDFSFLAFLKRERLPFDNESFLKFSKQRFASSFPGPQVTLAELCNFLNFSCNIEGTLLGFPGQCADYKFGFLNHSSVVLTSPQVSFPEILVSVCQCIFGNNARHVWMAVFDDCISCTFCLFTTALFPSVSQASDELSTSLELNSVEGFFLLEDFELEGNSVRVIRGFTPELPKDDFSQRVQIIDKEHARMERVYNL